MNEEVSPFTAEVVEVVKDPEKKTNKSRAKDELIVIDLPPMPKDVCRIVDPVVESDLSLAIVSTICCWLPLGFFPSIFGCCGIYYAVKAKNEKNDTKRKILSEKSQNFSWCGILIFVGLMIIGIFLMAFSGVL